MTPRIAVAGWFGSDNLGDELILHALAEALRARGAEPVAISIDPENTRDIHRIPSIAHRYPAQSIALVRQLREVDAMAVAGGVVQSETSPWNLPFHASRLGAAAMARCPVSAVGLGVGRVAGPLGHALARRSLRRLRRVVVRDHDSARQLQEWGRLDVEVGADPVIGLKTPPVEPADTMGVILRPPNRRGLRTARAKASWSVRDEVQLERMAAAIDAAAAVTGLTPRLVAFQASRDYQLHREVAERLTAPVESVTPSLSTVLAEVGRCRLVVTMRYHGAIAALLYGRPAVLLDYSPKMASLAAEAGGWAQLVDPHEIDARGMAAAAASGLNRADRAREARSELRTRLSANNEALDEMVAGVG